MHETSLFLTSYRRELVRGGFYVAENEHLRIKGKNFIKDVQYEGKKRVQLDEDRIINEGLSGGSVHMRADSTNIEEAHPFPQEEPPRTNG